MQVSVRLFTTLREIVGKKEELVKLAGDKDATIEKLLKLLSKRYGKSFAEYVYDVKTGEVKSLLQFLVNGRSASTLEGMNTKLKNGDVLAIIPPVGGG